MERPRLRMLRNHGDHNQDGRVLSRPSIPIKTTEYTVHAISESIQNLARIVVPILRIVEQCPAQIGKISIEYNHRTKEYHRCLRDFLVAKEKSKDILTPLEIQISSTEDEIKKLQEFISKATEKIRQNDKWIRYRRCRPT